MSATSSKRFSQFIIKFHQQKDRGNVSQEFALYVCDFLFFYLKAQSQPSQTSKILEDLSLYIPIRPLRFLVSIAAYFAHGHIQDKPRILELLKSCYFSNEKLLESSIFVLVLSSFQAISESNDINGKVVETIDNVSKKTRVHDCVWKVVLNSPKARLHALNYLHYRLVINNKIRALHALIACFDDQSSNVKRCALELARRVFSFKTPEADKECKIALLSKALELLIGNDRPISMKIFEWIHPEQEKPLSPESIEIISQALLECVYTLELDKSSIITSTFIFNFSQGSVILKNIIIPLAIHNSCRPDSISSPINTLLLSNSLLFWSQFKISFFQSFQDRPLQLSLAKVLENALITIYDHSIIDALVIKIFEHIEDDMVYYLNYSINLLEYIDKTSIELEIIYQVFDKAFEHWHLLSRLLVRLAKLSVDCEDLIERLCEDHCETDSDQIDVINLRIEYNHKLVTKDDVEFVIKYSIETEKTSTLIKIIELIPKRVNSLLEGLIVFDSEIAVLWMTFIQPFNLKLSASLLNNIIQLFSDDDPDIKFQLEKWLTVVIRTKSDIFSGFLQVLEDKTKTPTIYITEALRILSSLKDLFSYGGGATVNLFLPQTLQRFLVKLQQLILNPPHYATKIRSLACEVACEIVKSCSSKDSAPLIDIFVTILMQSLGNHDDKMLLILMDLLNNHLKVLKTEAEIGTISNGLVNILDPLVKLIGYEERLIRDSWLQLIAKLIPFVIEYLDDSISVNYTNAILKKYFIEYTEKGEKRILLSLKLLTTQILDLHHQCENKTARKLLYFSLQKYLDSVLISEDELIHESLEILRILFRSSSKKFIKSFISLWAEYCPYDKTYWPTLEKYLDLLALIQVDLLTSLQHLSHYLTKNFVTIAESEDKFLSIGYLAGKLQEKCKISTTSDLWLCNLEIYKNLLRLPLPEMHLIILYCMDTLKKRIGKPRLDVNQQIELKKIVKTSIETCFVNFKNSRLAIQIPYPFLYKVGEVSKEVTIAEAYSALAKSCIHNIIDLGVL